MKHLYLFLALLLLSTSANCESNHLLKHIEKTSRDFYYIGFSRDASIYKQDSKVGGEHENQYFILAFEDETLVIHIYSEEDNVANIFRNQSYKILFQQWNNEKKAYIAIVKVIAQHAWVEVHCSAYPYADYTIEVERIKRPKY